MFIRIWFFVLISILITGCSTCVGDHDLPPLTLDELGFCEETADCSDDCADYTSFLCNEEKGVCLCSRETIVQAPSDASFPQAGCRITEGPDEFAPPLCVCPDGYEASCLSDHCICSRTEHVTHIIERPVDGGVHTVYIDGGREIVYIYPDAEIVEHEDCATPMKDAGPPDPPIPDASADTGPPIIEEDAGDDGDAGQEPSLLIGNYYGLILPSNVMLGSTDLLLGYIEFQVSDETYTVQTLTLAHDLSGEIDAPEATLAAATVRLSYRDSQNQLQTLSGQLSGGAVTFTGLDIYVSQQAVRALANVTVDFASDPGLAGQKLRLGLLETQSMGTFEALSESGDELLEAFTTQPAGTPPTLLILVP